MGTRSKSIVHYPTLPLVWLVKCGTNLTKAEVDGFDVARFVLQAGSADVDSLQVYVPHMDEFDIEVPQPKAEVPDPIVDPLPSEGVKRLRFRNGKPFCFVALPSADHNLKMESLKSIDCTVLKLLRVLAPGYGIIFTVVTPRSILKKELYEVTISNFPACTCKGFRYIYASALGNSKKKWILCKHLYFILQNRMSCTATGIFIHCLG